MLTPAHLSLRFIVMNIGSVSLQQSLIVMAELKFFKAIFHVFLLFIGQCHEDTLKFRMLLHQGSYFSCLFSSLLPLAAVDSQLNNTSLSGEHICINKGGIKKNTF